MQETRDLPDHGTLTLGPRDQYLYPGSFTLRFASL
jgi:hypothetical protein